MGDKLDATTAGHGHALAAAVCLDGDLVTRAARTAACGDHKAVVVLAEPAAPRGNSVHFRSAADFFHKSWDGIDARSRIRCQLPGEDIPIAVVAASWGAHGCCCLACMTGFRNGPFAAVFWIAIEIVMRTAAQKSALLLGCICADSHCCRLIGGRAAISTCTAVARIIWCGAVSVTAALTYATGRSTGSAVLHGVVLSALAETELFPTLTATATGRAMGIPNQLVTRCEALGISNPCIVLFAVADFRSAPSIRGGFGLGRQDRNTTKVPLSDL